MKTIFVSIANFAIAFTTTAEMGNLKPTTRRTVASDYNAGSYTLNVVYAASQQ